MIWGALGWSSIDEILVYAFFIIVFLLLLVVYLNGYLDCRNGSAQNFVCIILWLEIQPKNDAFLHIGEIRHAETKASK